MPSEFTARTYDSDYSGPARFILSHIKRHWIIAVSLLVGAFSNAALASAVPYFTGEAFDAILGAGGLRRVGWLAILIIITQLVRGVLQFMRNFSAETFAQRIERDVRDELYGSLLGKDMAYHAYQPVGEIMARVTNDVREMNLMFAPGVNLIVGSSMFVLLPIIASPLIHPALILVPLAFLVSYVLVLWRYVRELHHIAQGVRAAFGDMNARLAETLDGIEVVKGLAQEASERAIFETNVEDVRDRFILRGDTEARYLPVLLLGLATVGGLLHAIFLYRQGAITTGDVVNFTGQIALFGFPVFTALFSWSQLASGYAGAERILSMIVAETGLDQNEGGHSGEVTGRIEFKNVTFGYVQGTDALRDVSITVQPGQTVALVGQTGAGKSTLARLINRSYDVQEGCVEIDGICVPDWNLESLRQQISIIEQEIFLFSRTISENIAFGRPGASQEEIEQAARRAQAHDFIMTFPEGYETVIGQRGVTLSGGQRQRLAIARAFLTDPRILILDDSTSAIDSATEDEIQKAIWAAARGRTTILITHRLSQIRWADQIVVLQKGRVAAQGSHDELLATSEAYRRIFARYEGDTEKPRQDTVLAKKALAGKTAGED